MAAPVASSYTVGAGQPIYAGKHRSGFPHGALLGAVNAGGYFGSNPSLFAAGATLGAVAGSGSLVGYAPPAWLTSAAVGEWAQISGATVPNETRDYCSVALRETAGSPIELFSGANGGHGGNLSLNTVNILRLDVDVPGAWTVRRAASSTVGWDTTGVSGAYMPADGKPAPRHTYYHSVWVPEISRYMVGGQFWGSSSISHNKIDGFNPAADDWDAAGTYVDRAIGGNPGARDPATGIWYTQDGPGGGNKWVPATDTWSTWAVSGATINRGALAFDTARDQLFHLSAGDNFTTGGTIRCAKINKTTAVATAVTFNSSAAWTDFQADAASAQFNGVALEYDQDLDKFYFYWGGPSRTQRIYRITPNSGTTWDMDAVAVSGVTPAISIGPLSSDPGGVYSKFRYISRLKACVLAVPGQALYFIRMQ